MVAAADAAVDQDLPLTRIVVRRTALSEPARLAWAVRAARSWLGPEVEPAVPGMRRHEADLRLLEFIQHRSGGGLEQLSQVGGGHEGPSYGLGWSGPESINSLVDALV